MNTVTAQEEYLEWVGQKNDAFIVTVNGVIVTFVPDGSDIVAVHSIHPFISSEVSMDFQERTPVNDHLYLDTNLDIKPTIPPSKWSNLVEYDGITIRMRAHVFVEPNQIHHVRLVIADVDDDIYDSGLFIKKASIRTIIPQP